MKISDIKINDKLFYMHKKVYITKIFDDFNLVKVKYSNSDSETYLDIHALSAEKSKEVTLSLGLFTGR